MRWLSTDLCNEVTPTGPFFLAREREAGNVSAGNSAQFRQRMEQVAGTQPSPPGRQPVGRDEPPAPPPADGAIAAGAHVSESQIRMVLDISRMLAVPTDLDPLLFRIAEASTELLNCERASIFLHDPRTGELWTKVALKSPPRKGSTS